MNILLIYGRIIENRKYNLKNVKQKQSYDFDKRLSVKLNLSFSLEGDKNVKPKIAETIKELFAESQKRETDLFMLGNEIYRKEPKLWQKLRHNYNTIYKNSSLVVTVK